MFVYDIYQKMNDIAGSETTWNFLLGFFVARDKYEIWTCGNLIDAESW